MGKMFANVCATLAVAGIAIIVAADAKRPEEWDKAVEAAKTEGKIGFSDPRVPSSGQSIWSFMWELKDDEFLR